MQYGFYKVAASSPPIIVADTYANSNASIQCISQAAEQGAQLIVLPELGLTGYTAGDLFLQQRLLDGALEALLAIVAATKEVDATVIAGLPIAQGAALYNCAAVLSHGQILAVIPKTYIPNYGEFYEMRHFTSGLGCTGTIYISSSFPAVPFGSDIIIRDRGYKDLCIAVEICEDLWTPLPPSTLCSVGGATVVANISASNEVVGKADYRRLLVAGQSAKCVCAYVYADAGRGESTTDMVFAAHNIIAENGTVLAEREPFSSGTLITADIDIARLAHERRRMTTYAQCARYLRLLTGIHLPRVIEAELIASNSPLTASFTRYVDPHPFVPEDRGERGVRCRQVLTMQAEGLVKRLEHIGKETSMIVVGLSGGLDSTLALLVACRAYDIMGIKRNITAITMPCFGTTSRTLHNALTLARETGAVLLEVDITASVKQHLHDIDLSESDRSPAFENAQARERTQVLMDAANKMGGIVLGTGDLSELALGWCTYNGDQMSMYGVNSSIPKTLVRHLVSYFADEAAENGKLALEAVLRDILATPVSPELLPPSLDGAPQSTEKTVGPYELHDFFLYYTLRFGFAPSKVLFLAEAAKLPYSHDEIVKWMKVFYHRFFAQQFKRSAMPDGAKVGTVCLSPRGDWRMPSDASALLWLQEAERL